MKKVLVAFSVVALFAGTACNSEKDCECTTSINGQAQGTTTTTIEDGDCSQLESSTTTGGNTSTTECEEV